MSRLETLQEMHDYLVKGLHKAETELEAHRSGRFAPGEPWVSAGVKRVEKWTRWRDTVYELMQEELRATTTQETE